MPEPAETVTAEPRPADQGAGADQEATVNQAATPKRVTGSGQAPGPGPDTTQQRPDAPRSTDPAGPEPAGPKPAGPKPAGPGPAAGETTQRLPEPAASSSADVTQRLPVPADAETTQRLPRPPATQPPAVPQVASRPAAVPAPAARPLRLSPGEIRRRVTPTGPATPAAAAPGAEITQRLPMPPATGLPGDVTQVLHLPPMTASSTTPAPEKPASAKLPVVQPPVVQPPVEEPPVEEPPVEEQTPGAAAEAQPAGVPATRTRVDLGRAPAFLALSSLGVLLVALAYADGRDGVKGALTLYWIGQVVVFTPVVARLLARRAAGAAESFLLVMGLAVQQYLLKWMYSPDQFRFPDELQHWLATTVLMESGELFRPNPALPPAVHFPGLAEMGAAVADLTGLSVTAAGMLVAGVAHLLFVAALFAVVLRASNSPAIAGVACVVYATALHYLFFNSMYLYATGALPFLMVAVWAVRRWRTGGGTPFAVLALTCMFAATATHHVTAFMLAMTLTLIGVTELVVAGRPRRWSALVMPVAAFSIVAGWIAFVAPDVIAYLEAPIDQVANTVAVLLDDKPVDGTATTAEVSLVQLAVQGSGLLVLFALYLGVGFDMLQRHDRDPWRWAAMVGGGIFFAGNGVRFLGQNGPEIAGRLNTFTYVPISIIAGMALVQATRLIPRRNASGRRLRGGPAPAAPPAHGPRWAIRLIAGVAGVTLLMVGARLGGWPPSWALLPGPYLVAGYERSVDAAGVEAARWQRTVLGPGHRVGGDVAAVALSSTYGMQDPVRETASLFYADEWTPASEQLVRSLAVDYLVVDRRLATQLPALDAYFEHDPMAGRHTSPLSAAQLAKFDDVPQIDRLYDNGDIRIYRLGDDR